MSYEKGRTVYLLDPRDTEMSGNFGQALSQYMESQHDLKVVTLTSDEGNVPLLLLCHSYSRIGTDIETATRKLRESDHKRVAVLVIHVKEPHALPLTNPTDNLLDAKYDAYGCLVDFAFSPDTGIYECNMNATAEPKLNTFLKRFVDVTPRHADHEALPDDEDRPSTGSNWDFFRNLLSSSISGTQQPGGISGTQQPGSISGTQQPGGISGTQQRIDISAINDKLDTIMKKQDQLMQQMGRPNTDPTKETFINGIRKFVYEIHPSLLEDMQGEIMKIVNLYKDKDKACQQQQQSQNLQGAQQQASLMQQHQLPDTQQDTGLLNSKPTPMDAISDTSIDPSWVTPSLEDVSSLD